MKQWQSVNTNSEFTKHVVEKSWGLQVGQVIYPSVDVSLSEMRTAKRNYILSVGRFFPQLHSKRQDILVDAFRQLLKEQPRLLQDWELIFVGAVENQAFYEQIKDKASGLPIRFETTLDHQAVMKLYSQARLFWHATGYEVDQTLHPEKVEHFGIATVEAMAAGAIPFVIASGGQTEVLPKEIKPYCWNKVSELVSNTTLLLRDPGKESQLRKIIRHKALEFSQHQLEKNVRKLFHV
jgi:glycosyltransferase involved in cell wall biosynthesis